MASVAGTYTATTFTASSPAATTDLLAGGASISATLNTDGTTSGALHVPGALNNGTPIDEDLTGTWSLSNNQVSFHPTATTFLPDLVFTVHRNQLDGTGGFGGTTLHVVTTK